MCNPWQQHVTARAPRPPLRMVNRHPADHQRHARLERMRVKPVANSHHGIISGATRGSTPIVIDSTDSRVGFFNSLSITNLLNRGDGPKFISKPTSMGVALK